MDIKRLNQDYGIAGQLEFIQEKDGFPFISINNRSAKALISIYAAQVLSFQPHDEPKDLLFLSPKAYYNHGKAIRGGIPLCWPWFGPDPEKRQRPNHGFARIQQWTVSGVESIEGKTKITLRLLPSTENIAYWHHNFELILEITVGKTLNLELQTVNYSNQLFFITQAFHAYFNVGHIDRVKVLGFENHHYQDKLAEGIEKIQAGPTSISGEVDRIYNDVDPILIIEDSAFKRRIRITSKSSHTTVLWNPWNRTAAAMPDLDPDDYKYFVCVETGNVAQDAIKLFPDSCFKLSSAFSIERE